MMLTATSELAPGQWVDLALSNVVGMQGIILLVYVSALMFVMRHFAGTDRHSDIARGAAVVFQPLRSLWPVYSVPLQIHPCLLLPRQRSGGLCVCYMYPTMLASVSERYPRGGAFFMGLMGFAAGMAIQFVLPWMGAIFDSAKLEAAGGVERLGSLGAEELAEVMRIASVESFQSVAIVPLMLLPVFGLIWWRDYRRGGYRPVSLGVV